MLSPRVGQSVSKINLLQKRYHPSANARSGRGNNNGNADTAHDPRIGPGESWGRCHAGASRVHMMDHSRARIARRIAG